LWSCCGCVWGLLVTKLSLPWATVPVRGQHSRIKGISHCTWPSYGPGHAAAAQTGVVTVFGRAPSTTTSLFLSPSMLQAHATPPRLSKHRCHRQQLGVPPLCSRSRQHSTRPRSVRAVVRLPAARGLALFSCLSTWGQTTIVPFRPHTQPATWQLHFDRPRQPQGKGSSSASPELH
jgi:hypothetical protein